MDLRTQLATRFHIENIRELLHYIKEDERLREEIYRLIFDEDDVVSYQALWVCTHFSKPEVEWLTLKQDELIDAALTCPHSGKRRMLLNLLCQQQLADPPRVDLLDFCMERMVSRNEPAGVQSLSIKLAYQLTCSIPRTTARIAHYAGDNGTGIVGSCHTFSEKKYIESYPSKEKERTSELIIYSDGISGKYL